MVDVTQRLASLTPAQRQLLATRLKKNPQVTQPIAVVGMACRFPGARNQEEFWNLISGRGVAVSEIPDDRWDLERYFDDDPDMPGKMSIRWGAFVDGVSEFDSMFFGITPREAVRMDPQQRLLLEVTWEALENSGISADQFAGSATGVFVGIGGSDYSKLPNQFENYLDYIDAHMGTGNALSVAANRISYILDLRGPSLAIDTACSSGLVGLHMAIQALRNGDCDAAVAGAVNLILSPEVTIAFSKARMLSQTGECRPFDAAANGYVRGEGCGMIVLKRLTDATRDGDHILASIRGSAVNQDGRTSGITAPNSLSQISCIRSALASAGIDSSDVSYVEAHGTGTPLGDPIEFQSLTKIYRQRKSTDPPVHVTSVKANIGHTETVSGIAGLIKVVLMMKKGIIPAQANLTELNPNIDLDGTRIVIPRDTVKWESKRKIAGVSSFGFGGTNSHVIMESVEAKPAAGQPPVTDRPKHILAISAKSKSALQELYTRYADRLEQCDDDELADFCYSANTGRAHFNLRTAMIAGDRGMMLDQLRAVRDGKKSPRIKTGEVRIATKPKVAFLFTGQGSQTYQMGHSLYEQHPVFRKHFDECNEILRDQREQTLIDVVYPQSGESPLHETSYTQPALFALEYSLAQVWRSWGVEPSILLGHSVGEYVAACIAGVFSLEDGLRLIAKRAELMQQLPRNGKMAVIFAPRDRVEEALTHYGDQVTVATANGPENNVISGKAELVEEVVAKFEKSGVGTQRLNVSHAFHSPLMDPMLDEFESFASQLTFHRPTVPIVANRTGTVIETAGFDAAYWREHIRHCVEFAMGIQRLGEEGVHALLELGPTASLLGMGRRCLPNYETAWLPSLRKARDDWDTMLTSAADLYVLGVNVDWHGFDKPWSRRRKNLPNYPFQRQKHWLIDDNAPVVSGGGRGPSLHPLLGSRFKTAFESELFEARFSADNPRYLRDHRVQGSIVVPAAAYIEQGFALANLQFGPGHHAVENLAIQDALFLPAEGFRVVQVTVSPELGGRATFDTYSMNSESSDDHGIWQLHVTGSVVHGDAPTSGGARDSLDLESVRKRAVIEVSQDEFYDVMAARNLVYGDSFRVLGSLVRTESEAIGEVALPDAVKKDLDRYHLHPSLGDALMQTVAGTVPLEPNGEFSPYTYVPVRLSRARILGNVGDGTRIYARRVSSASHPSPESVESQIYLLDAEDNVIVEFDGVVIQRVGTPIDDSRTEDVSEWIYALDWQDPSNTAEAAPDTRAPVAKPTHADLSLTGHYVIFADEFGYADALATEIRESGGKCSMVHPGESFVEDGDSFTVRPTEPDDYRQLLETFSERKSSLTGVVHLWTVDCKDPTADSPDANDRARDLGVASVLRLIQQIARRQDAKPPAIWLVTGSAQSVLEDSDGKPEPVIACQSPLWGMGRVAAIEHPELACRLVDLGLQAEPVESAQRLAADLSASTDENQIVYRDDQRFVPRLISAASRLPGQDETNGMRIPSSSPFRLRIMEPGSFDALKYEAFRRPEPGEGQVEMEVRATGLNFSDVLKALGLYPGITDAIVPMGIEASGVVTAIGPHVTRWKVGDDVMGVAPFSFASHAVTADYALVKKPANLDYEEASTIPITFLTAYYGLIRLADLQRGERVLIHAAAGGVGQAAIQIAKNVGAEIFATAGSDEKREFLRSLGVPHVMNSRTLDFAEEIREITGRQGVDVVLNSLPGDAITDSLGILRAYGRFLEIGKTDIYSNTMIGLRPFQDNLSYFAIDLDRMLRQRPDYILKMFAELMEYFEAGTFEPIPFTCFRSAQTIESFRYMAQRKNIGKVVVAVATEDANVTEPIHDSFVAREDGTYLITGGLGSLGLHVARWLREKGATHVALLSRREPDDKKQATVAQLESQGLTVATLQGDVTDRTSLDAAIAQMPDGFPPLCGVFHAAGVLADGLMFDMELDQLDKPLSAKVQGSWNLHEATRRHDLDVFVLFSSIACVFGSPGQSNYAAGNAYLDGLAALRQSQGLPGVSINWGPWADSGMAVDAGIKEQLARRGMGMLPVEQALEVMGDLIVAAKPQTSVMSVHWTDMVSASGGSVQPLLREVTAGMDWSSATSESAEDRAFRKRLAGMEVSDRQEKLTVFFAGQLANIMGMEAADLDVAIPLNQMGLDSLMAIELKNKIESQLQMSIPMAVFMNEPSVSSIATYVSDDLSESQSDTDASPGSVQRIDEGQDALQKPSLPSTPATSSERTL